MPSRKVARPIKSCTNCRQQKIRCDAWKTYPRPCTRCARAKKQCTIDPLFRPQKGGQVKLLREDLYRLQKELETLRGSGAGEHEKQHPQETTPQLPQPASLDAKGGQPQPGFAPSFNFSNPEKTTFDTTTNPARPTAPPPQSPHWQSSVSPGFGENRASPLPAAQPAKQINSPLQPQPTHSPLQPQPTHSRPQPQPIHPRPQPQPIHPRPQSQPQVQPQPRFERRHSAPHQPHPPHAYLKSSSSSGYTPSPSDINDSNDQPLFEGPFELENVSLTLADAEIYHTRFLKDYLAYLPVFESSGPSYLYSQSELLFWAVIITAALSDTDSTLYVSLVGPVKRLIMKVYWEQTPRSTHVAQALLVLANWPLPNEKLLDDCSYRFCNMAKCLGLQLGIHRGKFIYEFSRKQKLMPNAVKWRSLTWVVTYVTEQFLSAGLGLPSDTNVDYIIDAAATEPGIPEVLQGILKLAIFNSKLVGLLGVSLASPDGLMEAKMRTPTLEILNHDLSTLAKTLPMAEPFVEIVYLYVHIMLCCFGFLPDTPPAGQSTFIVSSFHSATRLVTVMRTLVGDRRITEYPVILRQASSFAAMVLFKLHLAPQFPNEFVESARHSIVTVHHLYRNVPRSWGEVQNDVTRIAKVLESLNYVLITHPYLLMDEQIMRRMRSHLTYSIFYELIWAVHESRRRNSKDHGNDSVPRPLIGPEKPATMRKVAPLPLFNQISTDAFHASTFTSPNGTTTTTLVRNAKVEAPEAPQLPEYVPENVELMQPSISSTLEPPTDDIPLDQLLQGIDWMHKEADDFLGWMPNAQFQL